MSEPLQISVHVEEKRYQPTQEKTVVPDWDAKTVTPDTGYALSKVTVEGMPEPTDSETFTENGTYDVGRIGTVVVDVNDVDIDLQDKTVTPTEQTQTVEADTGYDGLDTVTVNPIPPEYVVPTGSVEITQNGQGIDVAGKAEVNVNVPQGVFPSGTKVITENVTGEDVTNYAAVDVAVPGPSGTKQISITQNGITTEDVSDYADTEITVSVSAGVTPSEFFPLQKTTVTAGANAVATVGDYIRFVIGLIPADMDIIAISMTERKPSYDAYEVLLGRFFWYDPTFTQTTTYFCLWQERADHAWAAITNIANMTGPAVILQGTKLDVYYVPHILKIEDRFPEA